MRYIAILLFLLLVPLIAFGQWGYNSTSGWSIGAQYVKLAPTTGTYYSQQFDISKLDSIMFTTSWADTLEVNSSIELWHAPFSPGQRAASRTIYLDTSNTVVTAATADSIRGGWATATLLNVTTALSPSSYRGFALARLKVVVQRHAANTLNQGYVCVTALVKRGLH